MKNFLKRLSIFILLALLLIPSNALATEWPPEVAEISYQIEHSDRIIVGNVSNIEMFENYTLVTIEVNEWLMNRLPRDEIIVRTEVGTSFEIEGATRFNQSEQVILMLKDISVSENEFKVTFMENGKHPLSEKDEVMNKLTKESPFIGVFRSLVAIFLVVYLSRRIR
ncbi:hypothetical protein C7960_0606 [Methanohalophilus euhalobius]|jgi:hypothetical protein|uniref:Uncharacterized protein n=2 Tax=Methanohalophilus TaxID=2175 RepID=A0A285FT61_9EURY|nr:MAG: hypothetical protein A8273_850 [Methanohalophilus sp. 2-GBenrich]TCL11454.1 hypothetical protein C7960_0606 [Methanohalophilus euhalobius]SNY14510.1 hypothetical protein SAMN06295989_10435 [Methanohalophilus euhalobius]